MCPKGKPGIKLMPREDLSVLPSLYSVTCINNNTNYVYFKCKRNS